MKVVHSRTIQPFGLAWRKVSAAWRRANEEKAAQAAIPAHAQARVVELQREARSASAVLWVLSAAAVLTFAPKVPGVAAALGVDVVDTAIAMAVFCASTLVATAAYHLTGLSRCYWATDAVESLCVVGALMYLVYASGSAVSLFWVFVLVHGFVCAVTDPWPRRHQTVAYVLGPLSLAIAFVWLRGAVGDAIITVLLGTSVSYIVRVVTRTTRRVAILIDEKEALSRDLAALRVKEERSRIARELHDSLGADLTTVLWQARALEDTFAGRPEAQRAAELSSRIARSIQELRQVVRVMRAEPQPLVEFVEELRTRCQAVARLPVHVERCEVQEPLLLDGAFAREVMHAALEMVRNADQHAQATHIRVSLRAGERLALSVEDDGVGLSEDALASSAGGLRGVEERARILGGALTRTPLGPGTRLTLDVPLRRGAQT